MDTAKVWLGENIGIVSGESSTTQFNFFVTPLKEISIRVGDHIVLNHPIFGQKCPVLAVVKEIKNREEVIGATLDEKVIKTLAIGNIIGYVDLSHPETATPIRKIAVPVDPGSRVYLPYHNFLQEIFSRNLEGKPYLHPIHLGERGTLATDEKGVIRSLSFYCDAVELCRQHVLITSMTGAGKTHNATVITEELANKCEQPVIIFDPHGEYTTIGIAKKRLKGLIEKYGAQLKEYPFNFNVSIYAYNYEDAVDNLRKHGIDPRSDPRFSLKPLTVSCDRPREPTELTKLEFKFKPDEEVKQKQVTIFNMRGLPPEARSGLFTYCMQTLYEARIRKSIPPFFVIIEETGNLSRKKASAMLLQMIASEGVKNGISMCLLCQHPTEVNKRVLSQTGIQIMGRTIDPEDLEYLRNMAQEEVHNLPNLRVGEWLINGITILQPTMINVRDRYSVPPYSSLDQQF